MAKRAEEFDGRMARLVPWQQYLQAKWTCVLFETFKDIKQVWRIAEHGTAEQKQRLGERLSDLFYAEVGPAVFTYFGDDITKDCAWQDFAASVFEVAGLDLDVDFLTSSKAILDVAPDVRVWAQS